MDLGQDVSGLDTYATMLQAILRGLGGTPERFDTPVKTWRKILEIYGGTWEWADHEWKLIYKLCVILNTDRSVAYTRPRLIHFLYSSGKLVPPSVGPTPPTPPTPPVFDPGIITEPFIEGSGTNAFATFTGDLYGFTGTSDNDSVAMINQDVSINVKQQNNKITFTIDSITDGGAVAVDIISTSDVTTGNGTSKTRPTKKNKGTKDKDRFIASSAGDYEVYIDVESEDVGESLYVRFTVLGDGIVVTVSDVAIFPQGDYDLALDRLMHWTWSEATGTGDRVDIVNSRVLKPSASLTRTVSPIGYAIDWAASSFSGLCPLQNNENTGDEDEFDFAWDFTRHTVSFLYKRNGTPPTSEMVFSCQAAATSDFCPYCYITSGGNVVYFFHDLGGGTQTSYFVGQINVCDNAWHLITITYEGDENPGMRCWVDNVEDTSTISVDFTGRGPDDVAFRDASIFNLAGRYDAGTLQPVAGYLGDLILWERVLSPSAIFALYNSGSFLTAANIAATAKTYAANEWDDPGDVIWSGLSQPDDRLVRWQDASISTYGFQRDSKGPWGGYFTLNTGSEIALREDQYAALAFRAWQVDFDVNYLDLNGGDNFAFQFHRTNTAVDDNNALTGTVFGTLSDAVGGVISGSEFQITTPGAKQIVADLGNPSTNTKIYAMFEAGSTSMTWAFDNFRLTDVTPLQNNAITGLATINGNNWVKQYATPTFYESGENGFRIGSTSSSTGDHLLDEDIRSSAGGSLTGKTLQITFNYEIFNSGVVDCGFVDGAGSPSFSPGATGHGSITNPVGCTVEGTGTNQRVRLSNTGGGVTACSFDVTSLENGNNVWFQFDGGITGRMIITDFQITDIT